MSEQIDTKSGLTPAEERVMALLVKAWNTFYGMDDVITQDEMQRFKDAIHQAQQVFADRALHRAYPEYWNKP
jgi:hypothetical protein